MITDNQKMVEADILKDIQEILQKDQKKPQPNVVDAITADGRKIRLITSREICEQLGFRLDDMSVDTHQEVWAIKGAAPGNNGRPTLWHELVRKPDGVVCCQNAGNLRMAGYKNC